MSTRNIFESRHEFEIDKHWWILSEVSLKCKLMMVYNDKRWIRKCPARYVRSVKLCVTESHSRERTEMHATRHKMRGVTREFNHPNKFGN